MLRVSITLALLGLVLLVISFVPWQAGTASHPESETRAATRAEKVTEGRALFLAKGCATCHRHDGAGDLTVTGTLDVGPDLTNYQPDDSFVGQWLREPQSVRPTTTMPNLELEDAEIEALVAFLSAP